MKTYEIENFINKRLRRKCWSKGSYIYFNGTNWLWNSSSWTITFGYLEQFFAMDDWEEFTPPKKIKVNGWVNIYKDGLIGTIHKSRESADHYAGDAISRTACVEIDLEVVDGEGLK